MSGLSFGKKRRKRVNYEVIQEVLTWMFRIALVCFLAFVLVWYFGEVSTIGDSMNPRLENGDITLMNRLVYEVRKPKRGEVIAFRPNGSETSHCYIKRVIGLPGETVSYEDGRILIDGEAIEENYVTTQIEDAGLLEEPISLGQDEYFVLGDDRKNSEDSRSANVGNVKQSEIAGKVWIVISPIKHFGFVK